MKSFGTAVILAGGKSSRMGYDKQELAIKGQRLLASIINALSEYFEDIVIVSNTLEAKSHDGFRSVKDEYIGKGPLAGIHAGLKAAKSEYVFFMACDMPSFDPIYMKYIKGQLKEELAAVTIKGDWIEPFHAFYKRDILPYIEESLNSNRKDIYSVLKMVKTLYISEEIAREYTPDWSLFFNINTIDDLKTIDQKP